MKKYLVPLLIVLLLSVMLQAQAGAADFRKTKIAVLDFQLQGEGFETQDMGIIVAEWFITALVKAGRFEVIERGLLKKLLEEQKLSMTGVVDATTATQIGKFLGVKTIISGSVMKLQNVFEI
ncbi:MAG: CsgG/HfaB family protein, partial [Proteobacteria bacterium]|nr:CsgG/HfaB family protein [Pseudomonadota bacterium]